VYAGVVCTPLYESLSKNRAYYSDFSVVFFRPNFMLISDEHLMKTHKNQWLLDLLSPPDIPWGDTNQGAPHGV
jgi:hypothetical protein